MSDSDIADRTHGVTRLSSDQLNRLYQRHRQGAIVNTGAIITLWLALLPFCLLDAIVPSSFLGISITGLLVILINIPFLYGLKYITHRVVYEYYNLSINLIEVIGDTIIIYFLGGIKGMYLILIYAGLVTYVGVSAPKRYPYIIATFCAVSFGSMALLEHFGILPHQNNIDGYHYSLVQVVMIVLCFAATLYVLSFLVAYAASVLKKTRAELKRQNVELKASREAVDRGAAVLQERNTILQKSIEQLQDTQSQLLDFSTMAELGKMVAGVSREIDAPLDFGVNFTTILNNKIRRLAAKAEDVDITQVELKQNMKTMQHTADEAVDKLHQASTLVKDFKQLAEDQSGRALRRFDLRKYIEGLIRILQYKYKTAGHKITLKCPDSLTIRGYPDLFAQIVYNLLMNSLIHGFDGINRGEIVMDISLENDWILLHYEDNGRGMEAATVKQIFEPFFTTRQEKESTGLGLYIVYHIVTEAMGGTIKCDTASGMGTSFIIRLPRQNNFGFDSTPPQ